LANTNQYFSITAGNEVSTISHTDELISGLSLSPISGNYLLHFNAQYNIVPGNNTAEAAIALDLTYASLMAKPITNSTHSSTYGAGETLSPGVYSNVGAVTANGTLTLDANHNPNAEFIFQFGAAFSTAASFQLNLINGASACNVYWIAEGAIALGASTSMKGMLLSNNGAVSMGNLSSVSGSLYTRAGAIEVDASAISQTSGCVTTHGILDSYSLFTKIGVINNVGNSFISGNIATNAGAVTGFSTATLAGNILPVGGGIATANFSLYQNGIEIPFSSRKRISSSSFNDLSLQATTTHLSGENIEVRCRVDSGTLKVQNRIFTILRVR
jgi:hypothetical protein